jgi:hypothetical protein
MRPYMERFLSYFGDSSLGSQDMLSPNDPLFSKDPVIRSQARAEIPSLDARVSESMTNPMTSHIFGSAGLGLGTGYAFALAAGGVTGVIGGLLVAGGTYALSTAVTGYRNYAYRTATGYERPRGPSFD